MNKAEIAAEKFESGYNCAQSVFTAFSDGYGIEHDAALKLSSGFGGGYRAEKKQCFTE